MQAITLDELERTADAFDEAVAATAGIDHFCSSSAWILPAQAALMPRREPCLFRGEAGYVALMRGHHPEGWRYLEPLESMWGLACPVVGPNPGPLALALAEIIRDDGANWDVALLSGLAPDSSLCTELVAALSLRARVRLGPRTVRQVARLDGGLDAFLRRRSRNFRRSLRRSLREAEAAGISFEPAHAGDRADAIALYERILAIETRSWKGREGVGITAGGMHGFYRDMLPRLAARDRLRVQFARHRDRDVGYILGAVFLGTYRGLQFSFDAAYRPLGLGNLCQYHQIATLCDEGVTRYDLGTEMDYKRRWSDGTQDTVALIAIRH